MKINFPFNPTPLGNDNTQFEVRCGVCGESLIIAKGDAMSIHVGESGKVDAVLCTVCAKPPIVVTHK